MSVTLQSVTFNHDPTSSRGSALNIRINGSTPAQVPEWVNGASSTSPAAYAISDTLTARIQIAVDLVSAPNTRVFVRAIPANPFEFNVLGPTETATVNFAANGKRNGLKLTLQAPGLAQTGVGAFDVNWRWQYKDSFAAPWTDFATTEHRILVTLQPPTRPWVQTPFAASNTQLPWAEVLEWACQWAAFTGTPGAASRAITSAVFNLGPRRIAYDCTGGNPTNYSYPEFDCSAFLERLAGQYGRGPRVNCTDCATIVSTFANALGADLWQSRMFNQVVPFRCNMMRLIGAPFFGAVCGTGFFNYHEVAWEGACSDLDDVFDACLEVFFPAPPALGLSTYVPQDVNFGWAFGNSYRDYLVSPESRYICQAQPTTRRRRLVY
ncbi:MAG: hypothetical protein AAFU86_09995 [Pseudomonadota bacterium]